MVVVGGLILAGAVNTAIIGSNGVLNRVAEDGVMPEWFLKPHPRYGTTYRILYLIFGLQLFTIVVSCGNVLLLGEAYAFGVVWSFVFQALAMVVLRFKRPPAARGQGAAQHPRRQVRGADRPDADPRHSADCRRSCNLLTKEMATIGGLIFTAVFFTMFYVSERYLREAAARHEARAHGAVQPGRRRTK